MRTRHVHNPLRPGQDVPLDLSLTAMSEYDFRPGRSLKLKRTAEDGVVKKCVFIHSIHLISFISFITGRRNPR
jgi:hypothetical protein